MFSSVGEIVGLIEIEPAGALEAVCEWSTATDDECPGCDATLADVLAQLVGRPAAAELPPRLGPPALPPSDRWAVGTSGTSAAIVLGADLHQLAADLDIEAGRLRSRLAAAGLPAGR